MQEERLIRDEDKEQEVVSEIICVVDRSGSMHSIVDDAVGGYNSFIEDQRKIPGKAYLTLYRFDDICELVYECLSLDQVPVATRATFPPRNATALYDAIGRALEEAQKRLENVDYEYKVIVIIITDGMENASRHFTSDRVKSMIEDSKSKGWEFLYLGANQDVFIAAEDMGIALAAAVSYEHSAKGITQAYYNVSNTVSAFRQSTTGRSENE